MAGKYEAFTSQVWRYYKQNKRVLPWRNLSHDDHKRLYQVIVSEFMLQQTQVSRVLPKYEQWMTVFPDMRSVSEASLEEVLTQWQGLGYNRRAKYLQNTMASLMHEDIYALSAQRLCEHQGIGANTAAAILVYGFNQPIAFIETNIRTVYLYHFFPDQEETVHDARLLPIVRDTIDAGNPREWYWALMDYGSWLKKQRPAHARSHHYRKQKPFEDSTRQVRARVLRQLLMGPATIEELSDAVTDARLHAILHSLVKDGLIAKAGSVYRIASKDTA